MKSKMNKHQTRLKLDYCDLETLGSALTTMALLLDDENYEAYAKDLPPEFIQSAIRDSPLTRETVFHCTVGLLKLIEAEIKMIEKRSSEREIIKFGASKLRTLLNESRGIKVH